MRCPTLQWPTQWGRRRQLGRTQEDRSPVPRSRPHPRPTRCRLDPRPQGRVTGRRLVVCAPSSPCPPSRREPAVGTQPLRFSLAWWEQASMHPSPMEPPTNSVEGGKRRPQPATFTPLFSTCSDSITSAYPITTTDRTAPHRRARSRRQVIAESYPTMRKIISSSSSVPRRSTCRQDG